MSLSRPFYKYLEEDEVFVYELTDFWRGTLIVAAPDEGASTRVEYRFHENLDYVDWPFGVVTEYTADKLLSQAESFRFTSTNGQSKIVVIP